MVVGAMKRLAVTGSRVWRHDLWWMIWHELHDADHLILGDCPTGADLWARRFAEFYQRSHRVHYADWDAHGPSAGPLRNSQMALDNPTHAVAFAAFGHSNNGTRDCYRKLRGVDIVPKVVRA